MVEGDQYSHTPEQENILDFLPRLVMFKFELAKRINAEALIIAESMRRQKDMN